MDGRTPHSQGTRARLLIPPLAALCLAVSALIGGEPDERAEATKVAAKVARAQSPSHEAKEETQALQRFREVVADYARLQARLLARLRDEDSASGQNALAHAVELNRSKARQGDVFRPDVQPLFRRLIAAQLKGQDALAARKAVSEGNPEEEPDAVSVVVRVNGPYSRGAPLSTVPASVLLTLPPLPALLQYRFVGRDLILLDSAAGLIVDFLPAAAPSLPVK